MSGESSSERVGTLGPMCQSAWRQHVIALGVLAAVVLGFALNLHFGRGSSPWAAVPGLPNELEPRASEPGLTELGSPGARPVAGSVRTSLNRAVQVIRPSTLAVRATYGADALGQPLERIGSAVVVDGNGYAVTCQHVVAGASRVRVRRFREPERWLDARIVAAEEDLALLRIADDAPFVAATFGDSSKVQVGDWVLAAGHPFELGLTVSAGIVSRRNATLTLGGGRRYTGLLQTDAAINEGSSGGPLVDIQGNLIGLSAAIYAPSGNFSGASFAIDGNQVRDFVTRNLGLQVARSERLAWGLGLAQLTPELAARLACPTDRGVVVSSVSRNSPAAAAAIAAGDVITAIGGVPVPDLPTAEIVRERVRGGNSVSVELWRNGARHAVLMQLNGAG